MPVAPSVRAGLVLAQTNARLEGPTRFVVQSLVATLSHQEHPCRAAAPPAKAPYAFTARFSMFRSSRGSGK
jgi:hypothetical protein